MGKKVTFSLLITLGLFLLFLPTLLSTTFGKSWIQHQVEKQISNKHYPVSVRIQEASFSWLFSQKLQGLFLETLSKTSKMTIATVEIHQGLLSLLLTRHLETITLNKPKLILQETTPLTKDITEEPERVLASFLGTPSTKTLSLPQLPIKSLHLRKGSVTLLQAETTPTKLDQIDLEFQQETQRLQISSHGVSYFAEKEGTFSLDLALDKEKPAESTSFWHLLFPQAKLQLKAHAEQFPTNLIDAVALQLNVPLPPLSTTLGPFFELELIEWEGEFALHFQTEKATASGYGKVEEGVFHLTEPFLFAWQITNDVVQALFPKFSLENPFVITASLTSTKATHFLKDASFTAKITPFSLIEIASGESFSGKNIAWKASIDQEKKQRDFNAVGEFVWRESPFTLTYQGEQTLGAFAPICTKECLTGNWTLSLDQLPLDLLVALFPEKTFFVPYIGQNLTANLNVQEKNSETHLSFSCQSEHLKMESVSLQLTKTTLRLVDPTTIDYQLTLPNNLSTTPLPLTLDCKSASLTLGPNWQDSLALEVHLSSTSTLTLNDPSYPFLLDKLQGSFEAKATTPLFLTLKGDLLPQKEKLQALFGNRLPLYVEATIEKQLPKLSIEPLVASIKTETLNLSLKAAYEEEALWTLLALKGVWTPTQEGQKALLPTSWHLLPTAKPPRLTVSLIERTSNTSPWHLTSTLSSLSLEHVEEKLLVEDIALEATFDPKEQLTELIGQGKAQTDTQKQKGTFSFAITLGNLFQEDIFNITTLCPKGTLSLQQMPTAFLSLLPLPVAPASILGNTFSLELFGSGFCETPASATLFLQLKSEGVSLESHMNLTKESLWFAPLKDKKNMLRLAITPKLMQKVFPHAPPLTQTGSLELVLDQLTLPIDPSASYFGLTKAFGSLSWYVSTLSFSSFTTPPLSSSLDLPKETEKLTWQLDAPPFLTLSATFDRSQQAEATGNNLSLSLASQAFPTPLLATFFGEKAQYFFDPLLGKTFQFHLHHQQAQGKGPLDLSLQGDHLSFVVPGYVQDQVVYLRDEAKGSLELSKTISMYLLGEVIPILSTATHPDKPLTLTIDPEGFSYPLTAFDLYQLTIDHGVLDMGTIEVLAEKDLLEILQLLKVDTIRPKETIWFTPAYFSFKGGTIYFHRFDFLLANTFPLALWGRVDLANDKIRLKLGLGAQTLEKAFGIQNLPDTFMLPLSLKGSLHEAHLDKKKAIAKVGALIAQSKGNPQGLFLGSLLELLSGSFQEEKAPPPTTSPFPWETSSQSR